MKRSRSEPSLSGRGAARAKSKRKSAEDFYDQLRASSVGLSDSNHLKSIALLLESDGLVWKDPALRRYLLAVGDDLTAKLRTDRELMDATIARMAEAVGRRFSVVQAKYRAEFRAVLAAKRRAKHELDRLTKRLG